MKTGQSKRWSLIEAWANTLIGYFIAIAVQEVVFPLFGIFINQASHFAIGFIFLVASIIRGYYLRRFFNRLHLRLGR